MDDTRLNDGPRFHRYLPGIYQAQAQPETPLYALLATFEGFVSRIEQGIEDAPSQFDPNSARPEFLDWLASWVALPLDDEWNAESQRARKSYLISHAAELYRLRGTATGLKYMLSAFHDLDAEILEWTWPACMQIGVTSTIGVDCTIIDLPDLNRCFVLVLYLNRDQKVEMENYVDLYPTSILGYKDKYSVSTPVIKKKQLFNDSRSTEEGRIVRKLEKIRSLIENEKPAHTRYYVLIDDQRPMLKPVPLEAMIIGVHSTIGSCVIA